MNFASYDYSVLKYVHDRTTGEFVNVGVILYSADKKFLAAKCRDSISRISSVFPDFQRKGFIKNLHSIVDGIEKINDRLSSELQFQVETSLKSILCKVLPFDDSSLQWSDVASGLAVSLPSELDHLYERYVSKYDVSVARSRRTESDIWRDFERELNRFVPAGSFVSKTISVGDDEIEFKHAWKNGIWHCIEPVSFDLADRDNLKDKAHRWLGQITSIMNAKEHFKIYLILSRPQESGLSEPFEKAMSILNKMPVEKEIYLEDDKDFLAKKLAEKFCEHNQSH